MDEWEVLALRMNETDDPYSGQEGRLEALCRTLIADVGDDGTRAKEQMFEEFLSWCKRPGLPPKETMSLKVAKALGYITDEKDTSKGESSDKEIVVAREFHDAYESRKESLSKHEMLNIGKEKLFDFCQESWKADQACTHFSRRMNDVAVGRRLIVSDRGFMGLAPEHSKKGDMMCILFGGRAPFILRESAGGGHRLAGECYVHGIMDGEALNDDMLALPSMQCPTVQDFEFV